MVDYSSKQRRFSLSVAEMLAVVGILAGLWAILVPALDAAHYAKGMPPQFPHLKSIYDPHPWLFIVGTSLLAVFVAAALFAAIRFVLPQPIRKFFAWRNSSREETSVNPPAADSPVAIAPTIIAALGTTILLFAASHIRVDSTVRLKVVTAEGPISHHLQIAVFAGWALSAISIASGFETLERTGGWYHLFKPLGLTLGILNITGTLIFYTVVYEN